MNQYGYFLLAAGAALLLSSCATNAEPPTAVAATGPKMVTQALSAEPDPAAGAIVANDTAAGRAAAITDERSGTSTVDDSSAVTQAEEPAAAAVPDVLVPAARMPSRVEAEHTLATVYFPFDGFKLSDEASQLLSLTANWLRQHQQAVVRVAGHADERGTSEYNLGLGQRRAESVRAFLVASGIGDQNLRLVSMGEEVAIDPGHSEMAWAANRRVEFTILDDTVTRR